MLIGFVVACADEPKKVLPFEDSKDYKTTMILSHQEFLKKEKSRIKIFIDSLGLPFEATGTGLRYYIYQTNQGDSIQSKDFAFIIYVLTSLEGDTLYQSPHGKLQEFIVDYDNVESGLHEGIKRMRVGEKAYFILPAHLAHGISGDNAAISSQTTLVYNIHLVAKK
ncbi:MAG: FKBP-type peptidyl-prolyl cis-trans isomerase [Vicingaceae bacterium]|jgi:FKBP-type peptidyl-prolyl cis-trans isomerase